MSWRYLTWSRGGGMIVGDDPCRAPTEARQRHRRGYSGVRAQRPAEAVLVAAHTAK